MFSTDSHVGAAAILFRPWQHSTFAVGESEGQPRSPRLSPDRPLTAYTFFASHRTNGAGMHACTVISLCDVVKDRPVPRSNGQTDFSCYLHTMALRRDASMGHWSYGETAAKGVPEMMNEGFPPVILPGALCLLFRPCGPGLPPSRHPTSSARWHDVS